MSEEIVIDYTTGLTIYFHRFLANGNVFLTNAATNEVYGTGGRDADDYNAPMTEEAAGSGHYLGTFASGGTAIAAGVYQIQVKVQDGANPADSPTDVIIYKGEIYWDGTAEINEYTLDTDINTVIATLGQVHTTEDESPSGTLGASGTSGIAEGC